MLIGLYRFAVSPALPKSCRFYPSCSQYAAQAIAKHGAWRGVLLAASRLVRCNPWNPGGVDLVP
ncbi:MAG: membrane protein insertion efficiency factor YidD [Candidatus Eremiobacteraeota bacterium]|nr:membrane protein insertion efficiency factor YidD [Candidatus Eremiobacteraeota bacterium]